MDLIADIGATNCRCALLDDHGKPVALEVYGTADFTGVEAMLDAYLDRRRESDSPRRAALAVAAPILADRVRMINAAWEFSQRELKERLGLHRLVVVNDFAAVAWGLPDLGAADLRRLGGGEGAPRAALATLGPGSGLGVAALVPATDGWSVVSGEGGHLTLAAATDEEAQIIGLLRARHGHCSAERLLSGPGLLNLHAALAELSGYEGPQPAAPADLTDAAVRGDPRARKTLDTFFAMLGTVAGNLALVTGARGGLFVAGGIAPRVLEPLVASEFRARFEAKGRYRNYMEGIPTYVVTEPLPAFRGLRRLLGYR
jgi:glucokinase